MLNVKQQMNRELSESRNKVTEKKLVFYQLECSRKRL